MRRKRLIFLGTALLCALLFPMLFLNAWAVETTTVSIPVIASGADCTAEIFDVSDQLLQQLNLQKDVEAQFEVECTGVGQHQFTVKLLDHDTTSTSYDHTVYTVAVDLFYDAANHIDYTIQVDDGIQILPPGAVEFTNIPNNLFLAGVPYNQYYTFSKVWQGDHENSIDWAMYNPDGTRRHKWFDKIVVSDTEWKYEAWFAATEEIGGYYIVETPPEGYLVRYENIGSHASYTDRCYNGGTIINYKVPKTQDSENPILYVGLALAAIAGIAVLLMKRKRGEKIF